MNKTKIEWVKNPDGSQGYTFNPITGCLNNCPYCYARKLANGRLKQRYLANRNVAPLQEGWLHKGNGWEVDSRYDAPFYPRFWPEKVTEPLTKQSRWGSNRLVTHRQSAKGIFVCDMGELFGGWIPREWQENIFWVIRNSPKHRFYLLTKQPQNLIKFSPFPDNCWVGVTAANASMAWIGSKWLQQVDAEVKYMSFEPLLDWSTSVKYTTEQIVKYLDWVIIGAQTKPYKPPEISWVEEIVKAADKAGIPVFLKNNLRDLLVPDALMDDVFWESDKAKLRQEMPG